jgi:low temperature requirement protein LtrA
MVGPLELFYDLAVVVLVAQAAHHLAGHLTWRGFGEFAAVFTLVWIAWANGSLHHELHGHDDARARSTFLLQILLLVAMAAFIPEAGGERGAAFAVAAGVLFAVLAVLWLLAARGDRPQYRRTSGLFVTGTAACAIALAATALLPASARVLAWGLIVSRSFSCSASPGDSPSCAGWPAKPIRIKATFIPFRLASADAWSSLL